MASRSVQQLCRAAFSLAARASSSSSGALEGLASPSAGIAASLVRSLGTAPVLRELARGMRTSTWSAAAVAAEPPAGINPLQQAPAPGGAAQPLGALPAAPAAEEPAVARAVARGLKISPIKLNMGMHIEDALIQCRISPKKSAKMCEHVLTAARANAVNNHGLDETRLCVGEAYVGKGDHLKRISVHGRGRSGQRLRYRAHLTVVLAEGDTPRRTQVVPMLPERQRWLQGRRPWPTQRA
eukprot:scaffold10.g2294.t1